MLNVLSSAYKEIGNAQMAKDIWYMGKESKQADFKGTIFAKRLVNNKNWAGIYVSPDSIHPTDGDEEHTFAAVIAKKHCKFSQDNVPLKHYVVNYKPTSKKHSEFQALYPNFGERKLNEIDYKVLEKIPFGFGLSSAIFVPNDVAANLNLVKLKCAVGE